MLFEDSDVPFVLRAHEEEGISYHQIVGAAYIPRSMMKDASAQSEEGEANTEVIELRSDRDLAIQGVRIPILLLSTTRMLSTLICPSLYSSKNAQCSSTPYFFISLRLTATIRLCNNEHAVIVRRDPVTMSGSSSLVVVSTPPSQVPCFAFLAFEFRVKILHCGLK